MLVFPHELWVCGAHGMTIEVKIPANSGAGCAKTDLHREGPYDMMSSISDFLHSSQHKQLNYRHNTRMKRLSRGPASFSFGFFFA